MKKTLLLITFTMLTFGLFAQKDSSIVNPHHFSMKIGYGFMPNTSHNDIFVNLNANNDHNNKVRNGINYEFNYDYNFNKNYAWGLNFSMFNAFDSYMPTDSAKSSFSDDRYVFYAGPTFLIHSNLIDNHYTLYARATAGYMGFRNSMRYSGSKTLKGSCLGYGVNGGIDYIINDYISFVGEVSYLGGVCKKVKDNDKTYDLDNTKENLSRFNFSVGVKIKL